MSARHDAACERRVWLITGTSSGLGRGIARAAIDRGECVAATARDVSAVADLVALAPARVRAIALDVTDLDQTTRAVTEAHAQFGRIDVLVNNAGYGLVGALEELDEDALRRQFETNLFGALALVRAVLPIMRGQRSGRIVQISSVNGVVPEAGCSAYVGTKFALEGMSEALAAEVAPLGIRVTIVEPGAFRTDFSGRSWQRSASIGAYAEVTEPLCEAMQATHGTQPGDPYKAGEAIVTAIEQDEPPLRLPLGADAYAWIRPYLEARLEQLAAVEKLGTDTAFPVSPPAAPARR